MVCMSDCSQVCIDPVFPCKKTWLFQQRDQNNEGGWCVAAPWWTSTQTPKRTQSDIHPLFYSQEALQVTKTNTMKRNEMLHLKRMDQWGLRLWRNNALFVVDSSLKDLSLEIWLWNLVGGGVPLATRRVIMTSSNLCLFLSLKVVIGTNI